MVAQNCLEMWALAFELFNSPLSIWMRYWDHLRKIYNYHFIIFIDHQVEFIKVTVNKSVAAKAYNQLHQLTV